MKLRYKGNGITVTNEGQDCFIVETEGSNVTRWMNTRQLAEMVTSLNALIDFQATRRFIEVLED